MSEAVLSAVFLTLIEAAKFLRIQPATLYGWVHQRRIPFRKHGGRLVFHRQELEGWSEKQRVEPYAAGLDFMPMGTHVMVRERPKRRSLKTGDHTAEFEPNS